MNELIITADDYGMSKCVNSAIVQGIDAGIITSTNVMMNMPFCNETEALKGKNVSIGLHWNLTCGKAVLDYEEIPSLVSEDGSFYSLEEFRKRFKNKRIHEEDIIKELTAQYKKYQAMWGEPDYWNTHENVHLEIKIHRIFLRLASELGMSKTRSYQRIYVLSESGKESSSLIWKLLEPMKVMVFNIWKKSELKKGITSPDGKICCLNEKDLHNIEYLLKNIQWKGKKIGELTFHPATGCDSEYFGKMVDNRLIEYRIVTNPRVLEIAKNSRIKLINFDGI